jgi:flagellar FliJ protein
LNNQFRDISTLMAISNYQARMDQDIKSAYQMLRVKEKERESVLKDFIEASKKRKILEKLKEKKLEEYHSLSMKDEAKRIDDINNSKWAGKAQ